MMTKIFGNSVSIGFDSNLESGFINIPHCAPFGAKLTLFTKEFRISLFGLYLSYTRRVAAF